MGGPRNDTKEQPTVDLEQGSVSCSTGIKRNGRIVVNIIILGLLILVSWWPTHIRSVSFSNHARTPAWSPYPHDHTNKMHTAEDEPLSVAEHPRNPAYLVKAYKGAVAAENGECSRMGVDVLRRGGNAVDAAISTAFCLGVVNMFSSGIGGGGSMVVRIPPISRGNDSEVWSLNFREVAPALSNHTMYKDNPIGSRWGGLAIAVPGELRGLQEAYRRWGTMPWKELVEPSVKLAAGWRVQRELARRIEMFGALILKYPDWEPLIAPHGVFLKEGDWVSRTNYSRTLSIIAEHGPDAFYEGPIADAMIDKVQLAGGILSHEDLKDYRIRVEKPLVGTYHGRKIYTTPAPGGGILLIQMLNVLENYDMSERTPLNVHRLVEAMKFAFASRTRMCDPTTKADIERISNMATKDYALEIVHNITDDRTHPPEYYYPEYDVKMDHGTSHTSVVDQNGMAVSLTSTVNSIFGSLVLDPVTGVLFNDEMDDFSVPGVPNDWGLYPSPYNYPEPGKMPVSSASPAIIENPDGSFYASIGGAGGTRIFPAVAQALLNLDWGLHASEAVEFGRLHDQLYPLHVDTDEIYPADALEYLRQAGHNVSVADINRIAAVVQLVIQEDGIFYAASDSRKNGVAAGY